MSSSVSSERAFSSSGITITKRRNRLKGDIVEALQSVKCAIRSDILIRPQGTTLEDEESEDEEEEVGDSQRDDMADMHYAQRPSPTAAVQWVIDLEDSDDEMEVDEEGDSFANL